MELIIFVFVVVALTVFPVMLAAKILKAKKSSFWPCLGAVVVSVIVGEITGEIVSHQGIANFIALGLTAVCFSMILKAQFIQGLFIAILSAAIRFLLAILIFG